MGRSTRGPRAQTKLPHGPAGNSNRLAANNLFPAGQSSRTHITAPRMMKRNPTPQSKGVSKMPATTRKAPTRRSALRFSIAKRTAVGAI